VSQPPNRVAVTRKLVASPAIHEREEVVMAITSGGHGGFLITGSDDVQLYRILTLRSGLALESKGLRLSRGRSCYAIVKEEFGFRGSKAKVLAQLDDLIAARKEVRMALPA
jgi:hypothetical protein